MKDISTNLDKLESMEIIGACDLFIGTRFHADILAAIMGVALVSPVGTDGPRIPSIMKMLGLDNCVCNIVTAAESHIMSAIGGVWNNRQEMRRIIRSKVSEVREKTLNTISVFREFCSVDGGSFMPVTDEAVAVQSASVIPQCRKSKSIMFTNTLALRRDREPK